MKGSKVRKLIENSSAIIVNHDALTYCFVDTDEDFNKIDIEYLDNDGLQYEWNFRFWEDDDIEIRNGDIYLLEEDGEYYPITLLKKQFIVDKSV